MIFVLSNQESGNMVISELQMSLSADFVSLVHSFQTSAELVITGCWLQLKEGYRSYDCTLH